MKNPIETTWELGRDKHGRRVTMTRDDGDEIVIKIHPANQRDDGQEISCLTKALIVEAAFILAERKE